MERPAHEAYDPVEAALERAERALHDALVLASYGDHSGADALRAQPLLGNVRTTATEYAHLLRRADRDAAAVREAVRAVVWRALATSGCSVGALRPIVEVLAPLLDPE